MLGYAAPSDGRLTRQRATCEHAPSSTGTRVQPSDTTAPSSDRFAAIYRRCRPILLGIARQKFGASHHAEDAVQTAFFKAWRHRDKVVAAVEPLPYLIKALSNTLIDLFKREKLRSGGDGPDPEALPEGEPEPDEVWRQSTIDDLLAVLADLPPMYREAFVMVEMEDKTYADVAKKLNISTGAVGIRVHRARKRLKPLLCARLGIACAEDDDDR